MAKIGIFDSGIGGFSVLQAVVCQAHSHDYIYLADSANLPYGEKSKQFVITRSIKLCHWLVKNGADIIVIACNTATTLAISEIRRRIPSSIPIIGIEPGIGFAIKNNKKKDRIIGVLATHNTLISDRFNDLLKRSKNINQKTKFILQSGFGLASLIESGELDHPNIDRLLRKYLIPMKNAGINNLVLGCTHYYFLISQIQSILGSHVEIINNNEEIAKLLKKKLKEHPLKRIQSKKSIQLCSTLDTEFLYSLAKQLIPNIFRNHIILKVNSKIDNV